MVLPDVMEAMNGMGSLCCGQVSARPFMQIKPDQRPLLILYEKRGWKAISPVRETFKIDKTALIRPFS